MAVHRMNVVSYDGGFGCRVVEQAASAPRSRVR